MSEIADRYRKVAGGFTARARAVPPGAWSEPAPCEGWDARDVVRHMVEWMPALLNAGSGIEIAAGPSVDDDPLAAWLTMSDAIQALLDSPDVATRTFSHPQAGDHALDSAIDMFITGDVLVHTWDLARAVGLDEALDPEEVSRMLAGLEPHEEMLRGSGQYGPRVDVPADADLQTRLIAFTGRTP